MQCGLWPLGGVLLKHLLDWWQLRFVEYDKKAYAAMKSDFPEMHPNYWDAVSSDCMFCKLALQFQIMLWTCFQCDRVAVE